MIEPIPIIRACRVCQEPLAVAARFSEETALKWVEDCLHWQGEVLHGDHSHWCWDWDGLPIDETTPEHDSCTCFS